MSILTDQEFLRAKEEFNAALSAIPSDQRVRLGMALVALGEALGDYDPGRYISFIDVGRTIARVDLPR